MRDEIIVIRTHQGEDIIATLVGEREEFYDVFNPYFVRYSSGVGISLMPYCFLTDQKHFAIAKTKVEFVATAAKPIAKKFLSVIEYDEDPMNSLFDDLDDEEYKH